MPVVSTGRGAIWGVAGVIFDAMIKTGSVSKCCARLLTSRANQILFLRSGFGVYSSASLGQCRFPITSTERSGGAVNGASVLINPRSSRIRRPSVTKGDIMRYPAPMCLRLARTRTLDFSIVPFACTERYLSPSGSGVSGIDCGVAEIRFVISCSIPSFHVRRSNCHLPKDKSTPVPKITTIIIKVKRFNVVSRPNKKAHNMLCAFKRSLSQTLQSNFQPPQI